MSGLFDPGAAAEKNNANQQAAAVENSQKAWQTAGTNFNNWAAANPSPVAHAAIQQPGQPTSPTAQTILGAPSVMGKPQVIGQQAPTQGAPAAPAPGAQPPQMRQLQGQPQRPQQASGINPQVIAAILGAA